jgi:hypothetical protein
MAYLDSLITDAKQRMGTIRRLLIESEASETNQRVVRSG